MKRTTTLLSSTLLVATTLGLAACGGNSADQALDKMHETFMAHVQEQLKKVQPLLTGTSKTAFTLNTTPVAGLFEGKIHATYAGENHFDITRKNSPIMDSKNDLAITADGPAGSLFGAIGMPAGKAPDHAELTLSLVAKTVARTAYVNISKLIVETSQEGVAFALPETVTGKWYGDTFDNINRLMNPPSEPGMEAPANPPIEQIISQFLGGGAPSTQSIERLLSDLHLWKGIELLPEKDGLVQIKVESDREQLQRSVDAFARYMEEAGSLPGGADSTAELRTELEESVRRAGSMKGVLAADKNTYEFRGFVGEIFTESGASLATVDMSISQDKESAHMELVNKSGSGETIEFTKAGSGFTVMVEGLTVAKGSISNTHVGMTVYDPTKALKNITAGTNAKEDIRVFVLDMPIDEATETSFKARAATLSFPVEQIKIVIDTLSYQASNSFKDITYAMMAHAFYQTKPVGDFTATMERKEEKGYVVSPPAQFSPFSSFMNDMMGLPPAEDMSQ